MSGGWPADGSFAWAVGVEDTFVGHPHPRTGRVLDEYALTQHDVQWREDLARIADLGVSAMRWGIPWYRVNPAPGVFDWSWTDAVFAELARLGIRPIVDLMHYGTPLWLEGAFVAPNYAERVAAYAGEAARRLRGTGAAYTPLNEPLVNAWYCGRSGAWPPNLRREEGYVRVILALAVGMARTIDAVRAEDPGATIVGVEAASRTVPATPELQATVDRSWAHQFLAHELAAGLVGGDHALAPWLLRHGAPENTLAGLQAGGRPVDVMGVNVYPTMSCMTVSGAPEAPLRTNRYGTGEDLAVILAAWHARFGLPVMVTETSDRARVRRRERWMETSIAAVAAVRSGQVPVVGYTWFPVFSHVDWRWRAGRRDLDRYWAHMGLWDLRRDEGGQLRRHPTPLVERYAQHAATSAPEGPPAHSPPVQPRTTV